jgi:hypothetical protein
MFVLACVGLKMERTRMQSSASAQKGRLGLSALRYR